MDDRLILASVGNTRTRIALAMGRELQPSTVCENAEPGAAIATIRGLLESAASPSETRILIASVNEPEARRLSEAAIAEVSGPDARDRVLRFGTDLAIPIQNSLTDDSTVGQDRLLDALGAFSRSQQACVVVDAGTAVTVDFVDGQGVFQGGAIAPGLEMMAAALHDRTSALPRIDVRSNPASLRERLSGSPFGKDTRHAIELGVVSAVRGLTHHLIDRYAEHYGAYPRVVATGGDAPLLFDGDELIELIVPDLTLIGMLAAVDRLRELDAEEAEELEE